MNKIINIMILSSILTLLGCKSKEKTFLEEHKVIFYNTLQYRSFENTSKVSIKEASIIAYKFALKEKITPMTRMFFVVDNQYVFTSYFNPKIPEASTRGIWVNAITGETKYITDEVRLTAYDSFNE